MREGTSGRGASSATSMLNLALRAVGGAREQPLGVVLAQMRRQLGDGAQVKPPVGEHLEYQRESSRQPGRSDPKVRLGIRQVQLRRRVDVHRWTRLAKIELPPVHLGQMPDQVCLDATTAPDKLGDASEQKIVGEAVEARSELRHASINSTEIFDLVV